MPSLPHSLRNPLNFVAFQAAWFACALSTARGIPLVGVGILGLLVVLHLILSPDRKSETLLLGVVALLGGVLDTALWRFGLALTPVEAIAPGLAPFWFAALYANFATTLRHSLAWLGPRPALASLLGAAGGPLTYQAGARLGALQLVEPAGRSLLILAVVWALVTPGFFLLERRLRRFAGD